MNAAGGKYIAVQLITSFLFGAIFCLLVVWREKYNVFQTSVFTDLRGIPSVRDHWRHTPISEGDVSLSQISFNNSIKGMRDDSSVADALKDKVRILIWVLTYEKHLQSHAIHVKNTWGKRATKLVFVSTVNDTEFPAVGFGFKEDMDHLVQKTQHAFRYLYAKHFDDADWFMKADDDTFVIVENLRYFLADKNPDEPVYYGQKMKNIKFGMFPGGGGGYVMSREALRRVATRGRELHTEDYHGPYDPRWKNKGDPLCRQKGKIEDVALAECMAALGVTFGDSTDERNQHTFFAIPPRHILIGRLPGWYIDVGHKDDKISHFPISFHHIEPEAMLEMEFLLYYARPYGIQFDHTDYSSTSKY